LINFLKFKSTDPIKYTPVKFGFTLNSDPSNP